MSANRLLNNLLGFLGVTGMILFAVPSANAVVVSLNHSAVMEFEHLADLTDGSHEFFCNNRPVRLRLHVDFNGSQPVSGFIARAGVDFDTSAIPDNATILSVKLELYVIRDFITPEHVQFRSLPSPVEGTSGHMCFGKYIQIENGALYDERNTINASYNTIDLGPQAAADLQNQLGADWFSVGLKRKFEGIYDAYTWAEISSLNSPNKHRLKVTYLIKGSGGPAPASSTRESTWGQVKAIYESTER